MSVVTTLEGDLVALKDGEELSRWPQSATGISACDTLWGVARLPSGGQVTIELLDDL